MVFEEYSATGVLHVHTTRSDGFGEPEDVVKAAVDVGLDFIAFNDHNNLRLMHEGWHGRITEGLVSIVGTELQHTDRKSHLLVYGIDSVKPGGHILDQLQRVLADGGLALIAHPTEKRPWIPGYGEFPWGFGSDAPVDGVEVWNWMSSWKRGVNPLNGVVSIYRPDQRVKNPPAESVDLWFETGGCAVGGLDAHAHSIFGKEVFSYSMLFQRLRTHILLDSPFTKPSQFLAALRAGRCFMSNAILGDASSFRSRVIDGRLHLRLPAPATLLIREKEKPLSLPVKLEAGLHSLGPVTLPLFLELRRNGRTWIAKAEAVGNFDK